MKQKVFLLTVNSSEKIGEGKMNAIKAQILETFQNKQKEEDWPVKFEIVTEQIKTRLEKVDEFQRAFNHPVLLAPDIPDAERRALRIRLIQEELDELKEAFDNNDLIEVADALCDLEYVLLGTVLECGLKSLFNEMFSEVHRSNMSKLDENGKPLTDERGKTIKSAMFSPPNLQAFLQRWEYLTEAKRKRKISID